MIFLIRCVLFLVIVSESWHNLHESAPVNVLRYYSFLCEQVPFTSVIKCLSKMAVKAADTVDHVVRLLLLALLTNCRWSILFFCYPVVNLKQVGIYIW